MRQSSKEIVILRW